MTDHAQLDTVERLRTRVAELEREFVNKDQIIAVLSGQLTTVTAERDDLQLSQGYLARQLAALKLTWTTARPTVPGLWFKKGAIGEQECVRVSHEHETGALIWMNFDTEWDWINRPDVTCQWAGPILLPEEGT